MPKPDDFYKALLKISEQAVEMPSILPPAQLEIDQDRIKQEQEINSQLANIVSLLHTAAENDKQQDKRAAQDSFFTRWTLIAAFVAFVAAALAALQLLVSWPR